MQFRAQLAEAAYANDETDKDFVASGYLGQFVVIFMQVKIHKNLRLFTTQAQQLCQVAGRNYWRYKESDFILFLINYYRHILC